MKPGVETVKLSVIRGRIGIMSKHTRAQSRLRRRGFTFEITELRNPSKVRPKVIYIMQGASSSWRWSRDHAWNPTEVIRPIAKHYIHKGGKP